MASSVTLCAAIALAGCGGSSAPTKSQYVAKANTICASARKQTAPLIGQFRSAVGQLLGGGSKAPLVHVAAALTAASSAALTKLEALKQPSGDEAAIKRIIAPLHNVVGDLAKVGKAVASGDIAGALAIFGREQSAKAMVVSAADSYGVKSCATVLSGSAG